MSKKQNYLAYGFRQLPEVVAASNKFTHAEKTIIGKVFDMMWRNKDSGEYAGSAFMSNNYLSITCGGVSDKTIARCKQKLEDMGMFRIKKRFNNTDVWYLRDIPDELVEEYEAVLVKLDDMKEKYISNKEILDMTMGMDDDELDEFFRNNPQLGVKV